MEIDGYKILEQIGQGGMAQVYKGYQLSLKRPVAIKVLTHRFINQADFAQRFKKESLIIARLSNPYIIPVIERGLTSEGVPYFIMEYVEGHELSRDMAQGQLDFNRKLDILSQVCKALSYAHRNNVIHRDIKPANIFIDTQGNARVLDFGIAQYYEDDINSEHTTVGTVMGTMAYMSPEQRQSATATTFKSDLFSLGVLMYKLFTYQDPVGRFKSPQELQPEIPHELSALILQCLQSNPEDRPASADEIKNVLLQLLRGAHIHTEQRQRAQKDFKQFELLDVIKEDEHGSVILFENRANKKLIIIKKRPVQDAGYTEAKLLTQLKHPNIINILGTSENKKYFIIVMEYLNGGNLQDRLVQPMSWQNFIPLAQQIASAMQFAHHNRITHGNLRPVNILFDNNEHIKLTDFGLDEHYTSSRQKNNWYRLKKEKLSSRLDIFSCGVVFYQMLVGIPPILKEQRFSTNVIFKKLPFKLKKLIIHMLEIKPQDRIESFSLVLRQLDEILSEGGATLVIPHKPAKKKKKKPLLTPAIKKTIVIVILLAIVLVIIYMFVDSTELQYFIEELFFPAEDIPDDQPNFIELTKSDTSDETAIVN